MAGIKYFFDDREDLIAEIPVSESYPFNEIVPFLKRAGNKYLRTDFGIGREMYDSILTDYQRGFDSLSADKKELVKYVRTSLGNFAFYHYVPVGSLIFGAKGIGKEKSESKEAAFKWERGEARKEFSDAGFEGIDTLLEFLEGKKTVFTTWANSNAFTTFKECFINTVTDFSKLYPLVQSRRTFLAIRHIMRRIEDHQIKNILSTSVYDALKTKIKNGNALSDTEKEYLLTIKPCVAHLTMVDAYTELSVEINEKGVQVLSTRSNSQNTDEAEIAASAQLLRLEDAARKNGNMYKDELIRKITPDKAPVSGDRNNKTDNKTFWV